jgi:glycosidase
MADGSTSFPRSRLRPRWWETSAGIVRPPLKAQGRTLGDVIDRLDDLRASGWDGIEIFAPYTGGTCYEGLDALDFYTIDPAIGTMDDFVRLLSAAHDRGMAVTAFINLGYAHEAFPAFLKASDDVRSGVDSPESRWFRWSATGTDTMDKALAPHFLEDTAGDWRWSERAQRHFWVKWEGEDGHHHLPQFDFADPGWQAEARRVIEFWLATGIDGLVIDAVNWYIGCDWSIARSAMTDPIRAADNQFSQPEGGGGFSDDPVPWISEGGFTCVMDYAIKKWWASTDVVRDAVLIGAPGLIEDALLGYRDRVDAAGGVCYIDLPDLHDAPVDAQILGAVVVATVGEIVLQIGDRHLALPEAVQQAIRELLDARRRYPALGAAGPRRRVPSTADHVYCFLRSPRAGGPPVLVVINFGSQESSAVVDLRLASAGEMRNILTGEVRPWRTTFEVTLPAYGFSLWALTA